MTQHGVKQCNAWSTCSYGTDLRVLRLTHAAAAFIGVFGVKLSHGPPQTPNALKMTCGREYLWAPKELFRAPKLPSYYYDVAWKQRLRTSSTRSKLLSEKGEFPAPAIRHSRVRTRRPLERVGSIEKSLNVRHFLHSILRNASSLILSQNADEISRVIHSRR